MPFSPKRRYTYPLLAFFIVSILREDSKNNKYSLFLLTDFAIWTLPVLPLWWLLIRWKKHTRTPKLRIVQQLSISLLSFLPWGIASWCITHAWLVFPEKADICGTGFLILTTPCLLAVSLWIGKVATIAKRPPSVPATSPPSQESEDICLINVEHNSAYDHVVITLNQYGKEVLEYWLTSLIPKYDHEFGCPDETSIQPSSGDDYTPCGFYNFSHAPVDDIYGEIQIKDYPGTLMLDANRNGIIRLLETVAALSEQQPETSCHANTVPDANTSDAHDIPKPYASVITFRFIKDVSAGMITPTET